MTCVFVFLLTHHTFQQRLDLVIALLVVGRLIVVATGIHLIDRHRDTLQVPHIRQRHLLRLHGQRHLEIVTQLELGIGQPVLLVTKFSQAWPAFAPLA